MTSSDIADATIPVQRQLQAYNARDIDAFMQCWAEDCEYSAFPPELLARGAAAIRARHLARFEEPMLFGALVRRICVGNVVVDQEVVTRIFPEGPGEVDVIAIYAVERGRIARAWFKMGVPRLHAPGTVAILPAALRDAGAIRSMTLAAYAKWVPVLGRKPLPMTADYDDAVRRHRIDLLYLDGKPVALIEMVGEPDHLLIRNVAVSPGFQGRGLGRRLLAHAERVAAELERPEIRLYTNRLLAENIRLYQRAGYAIDREEQFMGGITVHMRKQMR